MIVDIGTARSSDTHLWCRRVVISELQELYSERAILSYRLILLQVGREEFREQAELKRALDAIAADIWDRELWLAEREGWADETVAAWKAGEE